MNGENNPVGSIWCVGSILCASKSSEQVELLAIHKDGITVAEHWAELSFKKELEANLHSLLIEAGQELRTKNFWNSDAECNKLESQLDAIGNKYGHFRKNKRLTGGVAN